MVFLLESSRIMIVVFINIKYLTASQQLDTGMHVYEFSSKKKIFELISKESLVNNLFCGSFLFM